MPRWAGEGRRVRVKATTTIRDVARKAGVSIATVSRVLNGHATIKAETAERVNAAIEALKFRPSAVGRGLKTARTRTFGVLLPSLSNPIFAEVAEGVQEAARAAGYSIFITCNNYREADEHHAVETMLGHRVEGLILTVADANRNAQLDRLDQEGVPYVLLFNQPDVEGRSAVTVDNVAAGRVVAEELIQLGHARLGMIAGAFSASDRSRARFEGFSEGLAAAELAAPTLIEVDFVEGRVSRAIAQLYSEPRTVWRVNLPVFVLGQAGHELRVPPVQIGAHNLLGARHRAALFRARSTDRPVLLDGPPRPFGHQRAAPARTARSRRRLDHRLRWHPLRRAGRPAPRHHRAAVPGDGTGSRSASARPRQRRRPRAPASDALSPRRVRRAGPSACHLSFKEIG